ncbi:unnamed protein product [Cyprideis torosa]|uniref:Uncharacterized protein n=1 Tax=Cyprideis torosa TaxID=163714 RepID=A0A7R8ZS36_9CRUS|nr:unnamed protein product [Cyprideis torosa]CAG0895325.1 unnamed protein product [Cyprideis torosa]
MHPGTCDGSNAQHTFDDSLEREVTRSFNLKKFPREDIGSVFQNLICTSNAEENCSFPKEALSRNGVKDSGKDILKDGNENCLTLFEAKFRRLETIHQDAPHRLSSGSDSSFLSEDSTFQELSNGSYPSSSLADVDFEEDKKIKSVPSKVKSVNNLTDFKSGTKQVIPQRYRRQYRSRSTRIPLMNFSPTNVSSSSYASSSSHSSQLQSTSSSDKLSPVTANTRRRYFASTKGVSNIWQSQGEQTGEECSRKRVHGKENSLEITDSSFSWMTKKSMSTLQPLRHTSPLEAGYSYFDYVVKQNYKVASNPEYHLQNYGQQSDTPPDSSQSNHNIVAQPSNETGNIEVPWSTVSNTANFSNNANHATFSNNANQLDNPDVTLDPRIQYASLLYKAANQYMLAAKNDSNNRGGESDGSDPRIQYADILFKAANQFMDSANEPVTGDQYSATLNYHQTASALHQQLQKELQKVYVNSLKQYYERFNEMIKPSTSRGGSSSPQATPAFAPNTSTMSQAQLNPHLATAPAPPTAEGTQQSTQPQHTDPQQQNAHYQYNYPPTNDPASQSYQPNQTYNYGNRQGFQPIGLPPQPYQTSAPPPSYHQTYQLPPQYYPPGPPFQQTWQRPPIRYPYGGTAHYPQHRLPVFALADPAKGSSLRSGEPHVAVPLRTLFSTGDAYERFLRDNPTLQTQQRMFNVSEKQHNLSNSPPIPPPAEVRPVERFDNWNTIPVDRVRERNFIDMLTKRYNAMAKKSRGARGGAVRRGGQQPPQGQQQGKGTGGCTVMMKNIGDCKAFGQGCPCGSSTGASVPSPSCGCCCGCCPNQLQASSQMSQNSQTVNPQTVNPQTSNPQQINNPQAANVTLLQCGAVNPSFDCESGDAANSSGTTTSSTSSSKKRDIGHVEFAPSTTRRYIPLVEGVHPTDRLDSSDDTGNVDRVYESDEGVIHEPVDADFVLLGQKDFEDEMNYPIKPEKAEHRRKTDEQHKVLEVKLLRNRKKHMRPRKIEIDEEFED